MKTIKEHFLGLLVLLLAGLGIIVVGCMVIQDHNKSKKQKRLNELTFQVDSLEKIVKAKQQLIINLDDSSKLIHNRNKKRNYTNEHN